MNSWLSKKMSEITHLITDGKHGDCNNEDNSGYFFLSSKDLRNGKLNYDKPRQIMYADFLETHRRTNLEPGDVLLTNCGASIGRIGIAQDDPRIYKTTFQKSISVIKPNRSFVDGRYLYYFLLCNSDLLIHLGNGTAQPNLLIGDLKRIEVPIPPNIVQQRIADILSAYDNLIENNLGRIKILEEMAQNIYVEWFVKFRFPGYENTKMVDSPLGRIPEGWKVAGIFQVPYFDFIQDNIGPYDGVKTYYATADVNGIEVTGDGIEYTYAGKPSRAQKKPALNSVWCARMQSTYKVLFFTDTNKELADRIMISSGFVGFKSHDKMTFPFLLLTIKSTDFHTLKDKYCTGATQRSLTNEGLGHIDVIIPPLNLVLDFGHVIGSSIDEILILQQKNRTLRITFNLLLPRLISGELDVSDLDIKTGDDE